MAQMLTDSKGKVDAVLAENDGLAEGVINALADHGLAGKVAVSGEDGDGRGLNRVALGTQLVDVWKDERMLAKAAGDAAAQLCDGVAVDKVGGVKPVHDAGRDRAQLDPAQARSDHERRPAACRRRGLDHGRGSVPGRRTGFPAHLPVAVAPGTIRGPGSLPVLVAHEHQDARQCTQFLEGSHSDHGWGWAAATGCGDRQWRQPAA